MDGKNDIDVVVDNEGKDLEISPVYEHLKVAKPEPKEEKDKIIIPEAIKDFDEKTVEHPSEDYTDPNNVHIEGLEDAETSEDTENDNN